jgi:hypothetical protein
VLTVLHLVFKVPIPEVVMNEREWKGVRYVAIGLFCMNYAWVVFAHTQLHFH